jgi:hypothetical protein
LVIVLRAPTAATLVTVALVIVLPRLASIGRYPSPVPPIDSGNMWTSTADNVLSDCDNLRLRA